MNTKEFSVRSSSTPGTVYRVVLGETEGCDCPATVAICRHVRQARIRRAKHLAGLREQYRHELMGWDERAELADVIGRLEAEELGL
jgi:hypothetical protein